MKKFEFNLEPALKHSLFTEDAAQLELHRLLARRQSLDAARKELVRKRDRGEEELHGKPSLLPHEMEIYSLYIRRLEQDIRQAHVNGAKADAEIRGQKQVLMEAARKREALERLREKKKTLHDREADRLFQQEYDDLYLARLHRK